MPKVRHSFRCPVCRHNTEVVEHRDGRRRRHCTGPITHAFSTQEMLLVNSKVTIVRRMKCQR